MKNKAILFDASPMIDNQKTGVGYYIDHLISNLGETYGHKMHLCGYYFDFLGRRQKTTPQINGVNFVGIRLVPGKLISACRRLGFQPYLELFLPKRSNILLSTNYVALPTLTRRKQALIIYDLGFLDCPEFLQAKNLNFLLKFCGPSIQRADVIITISEFTKQRLIHHFPHLNAQVIITPIPPAPIVDRAVSLPANLSDLGMGSDYILYLGTIEPRKNITSLIDAYCLLPKSLSDTHSLVLAGGQGWKDEEIQLKIKTARLKGFNVITTGYITDSEKHALYRNAGCFVLPSHYEGFGMPLLEAMQYKLPVVASDIQVFREVAGDAALYFNKDDPTSIAKQLQKVISHVAVQQSLIIKGNKQLKKYSWARNARLVYETLDNL